MTTSRAKAKGSAAERRVAKMMGGVRVGQDGGPVDVVVPDLAVIQVKSLATPPSINEIRSYLGKLPRNGLMRMVVLVDSPGRGIPSEPLLVIALREWVEWYGSGDLES
jgi:hypothetical protein